MKYAPSYIFKSGKILVYFDYKHIEFLNKANFSYCLTFKGNYRGYLNSLKKIIFRGEFQMYAVLYNNWLFLRF